MEEFSISNTLSKDSIFEELSMFSATMEDAESRFGQGAGVDAISNEKIRKGDEILGTYEVISDAIHGGMGSVWRVHHKSWNADLAMKRPQPKFFAEGAAASKTAFATDPCMRERRKRYRRGSWTLPFRRLEGLSIRMRMISSIRM